MRIIEVLPSRDTTLYVLAEDEASEETYRIEVLRSSMGAHFATYRRNSRGGPSVKLERTPSFLLPFILEALGGPPTAPVGAFGEEAKGWATRDYSELLEAVRGVLDRVDLGSYYIRDTTRQDGWMVRRNHQDPEWDPDEYRERVINWGEESSSAEIRFRLEWGRTFNQDEITRAIVEVVGKWRGPG
jgi:hypothetical protein